MLAHASLRLCAGLWGRGSQWVSACVSEGLWEAILSLLLAFPILLLSGETARMGIALQRTGREKPAPVSTIKGSLEVLAEALCFARRHP